MRITGTFKACVFLLAFAPVLLSAAESVSIGVKGGVPITDAINVARSANSAYFTDT